MSEASNKTVLVVDDEPAVRKLVAAMVSHFGYETLTADSGEHALTVYKNHNQPLALLITDVVAPGMSGPMLADRLSALQPDLKVLFISGYDDTQVVRKYVVEKGHALLPKPFTSDALRREISKLLKAEKVSGGASR
jgi:two-component system, cell cycle sensor histidine kinase and response regulator CckA